MPEIYLPTAPAFYGPPVYAVPAPPDCASGSKPLLWVSAVLAFIFLFIALLAATNGTGVIFLILAFIAVAVMLWAGVAGINQCRLSAITFSGRGPGCESSE